VLVTFFFEGVLHFIFDLIKVLNKKKFICETTKKSNTTTQKANTPTKNKNPNPGVGFFRFF
jgi:hypothetical protein